MAKLLDPKDLVSFKDLLLANSIQIDALAQLLIEIEISTKQKYQAKLEEVQLQYRSRANV